MSLSMKNKILILFLFVTFVASPSYAILDSPGNFTGDSFYTTDIIDDSGEFIPISTDTEAAIKAKNNNPSRTIPPFKLLRLKAKAFYYQHIDNKNEINKAKEDVEKNQLSIEEEDVNKAPFESDDDKNAKNIRVTKQEQFEKIQIIIDCKHMDYITDSGVMLADGGVKISFPHQNTIVTSDSAEFNRATGKIHLDGDIVISKGEHKTYGDSIDIDLNEESIFISNPKTQNAEIKIVSQEGFIQRDTITQTNGSIDVDKSMKIRLRTSGGPDPRLYMRTMRVPESDKRYLMDGHSKILKIQANEIIISSEKELDTLKLNKAKILVAGKTVLKIPSLTAYSNKGHNFAEGNYPEIGSRRYIGTYLGPGFVVKLPKGCLLKLIPALTMSSKVGVGGIARFYSATNQTFFGYGTSRSKFVLFGQQQLDDNLKLIYAHNDYLDNWFLGRRMPKYGADLVYRKAYTSPVFSKKLLTHFENRASIGYFQDANKDDYFGGISGNNTRTTRFRYMAQINQPLFMYKNDDKQLYSTLSVFMNGSAALYGTGATQVIGTVGPNLNFQYKRWMQDVGFMVSAYDDNTPMPVFDAYRFGKSNVFLREYFRVNPYLTLAWQTSIALAGNTFTNNLMQECSFYASVGPDDIKVNVGFDAVRANAFINMIMAVDPKGTTVNYDKFVIKDPDNFTSFKKKNEALYKAAHEYNTSSNDEKGGDNAAGGLTKAIVEEIEDYSDDI